MSFFWPKASSSPWTEKAFWKSKLKETLSSNRSAGNELYLFLHISFSGEVNSYSTLIFLITAKFELSGYVIT